jgi:NADH dehydrogenase (ubiquinone) 1 alpha/beta subcomplex 1
MLARVLRSSAPVRTSLRRSSVLARPARDAFALARAQAPPALAVGLLQQRRWLAAAFLDEADVTDRIMGCLKNFQKVDPTKVSATSHFMNDLGLDSLDAVEVVMAFEDEFAIEIPDADAEKIHSCSDAIKYVTRAHTARALRIRTMLPTRHARALVTMRPRVSSGLTSPPRPSQPVRRCAHFADCDRAVVRLAADTSCSIRTPSKQAHKAQ